MNNPIGDIQLYNNNQFQIVVSKQKNKEKKSKHLKILLMLEIVQP